MAIQKKSLAGVNASKQKEAASDSKPEAKLGEPAKSVAAKKLAVAKLATAKLSTARLTVLRKLS